MPVAALIAVWMVAAVATMLLSCRFVNGRLADGWTGDDAAQDAASHDAGPAAGTADEGADPTDEVTDADDAAAARHGDDVDASPADADDAPVPWGQRPYAWNARGIAATGLLVCLTAGLAYLVATRAVEVGAQLPELASVLLVYVATLASGIIDIKLQRIPNVITFGLLGARVLLFAVDFVFYAENALLILANSAVGLAACFLVLTLARRLAHGGIGGGDIKLISAMGFALGLYAAFYALTFALLTFGVVALGLVATRRRRKNDSLPFGPFLYVGYVIALFLAIY